MLWPEKTIVPWIFGGGGGGGGAMLSRPVGMSLTALLLIVCFVACLAERRLLSGT